MKKGLLLLLISVLTLSLNAQVFTEYFEQATTGGDLEGYNDWYVSFKAKEANGVTPKIAEEFLFYENYAGSDIGKTVLLDSLVGMESATQRISTRVVTLAEGDTLRPIIGQKMYAAFLVQILPDSKDSFRDFFTWEGSTGSSWTRGRVFAKVQNDNKDLQFAVSKNSSSSGVYVESEIYEGGVNSIFLLVVEYDAVDGDGNDVVSLYINPDPKKPAAEQAIKLMSQDEQSDYSEGTEVKINIRQRGIGAYLGNIRVGRSWEDVVAGTGTAINDITQREITNIYSFDKTIVTDRAGDVEVFEITGRKVLNVKTNGRLQTSLKRGLYIVRFTDTDNKVFTGKVNISE